MNLTPGPPDIALHCISDWGKLRQLQDTINGKKRRGRSLMKTAPARIFRPNQPLGRLAVLRRYIDRTVVLRSRRIRASGNGEGGSQSGQEKQFACHRRSLLDQGSCVTLQFLVPNIRLPKGPENVHFVA